MKKILKKTNTVPMALVLLSILIFWALEKNNCFELTIPNITVIRAACNK